MAVAVVVALAVAIPATATADPGDPSDTQPVLVQQDDGTVVQDEVTDEELYELRTDPAGGPVVTRGHTVQAELAQSVPKVGAPTLWSAGYRGAGKVVVVIDTGVAATFGGTLAGQACFAANADGSIGYCGPAGDEVQAFDSTCFDLGVCDDGDPSQVLDPNAGRPCPAPAAPKDCAHGTAVAAVAARHDAPAGVAPDAAVYAIRVFNPGGSSADLFDIFLALDHVRQLSLAGMDIAAVNLSVSTSATFPGPCDSAAAFGDEAPAFTSAFAQLAALGIPSAVASGNDSKQGSLGFPACVSTAVSVGATDLDDDLADFGNRGPGLDLVAPGADEGNGAINAMEIPGSPVTEWAGTSFSAPHVAGAFALLAQQYPKASATQLTAFLRSTGVPVAESTGTYRRVRLQPADQALGAGVLFPTDLLVAGTSRWGIGDFDGDGHADVLAHGPGSTADRISYGRDDWALTARAYSVGGTYVPLVGNFRGNPADDILWYAAGAAADYLWQGAASRTFASTPTPVQGSYQPLVGDYDGDEFDDVLWYAPGSPKDSLWYGGPSGFTGAAVSVLGSYRVVVGDFDGDDRDDVVFHGPGSGADTLWRGTAVRGTWSKRALTIGGTNTLRAGDVNGDDADDLILYQPGSAADSIWRGGPGVGGAGPSGGFSPLAISVTATYQPAVGDLDGDGRSDIVWYAPGGGKDYVWFGRATGTPTSRQISVTGTYAPLLGDLDADAGDEIVWFSSSDPFSPTWWSHAGP